MYKKQHDATQIAWDKEAITIYRNYEKFNDFLNKLPTSFSEYGSVLEWVLKEIETNNEEAIIHGEYLLKLAETN
jgi:hypothetical protein